MEQSQLALKLVLDATGVGTDISTVTRRKAVQKAVYLAEALGVDLGYHYNWYVKGPYSPALTRVYYPLADVVGTEADDSAGFELEESLRTKLETSSLFHAPDGVDLSGPDWLELVASVHFLLHRRRQDVDAARITLATEKAHVAEYFDVAIRALADAGL